MKNILIATPSYDGKIDVWYANSLLNSTRLGLTNEINLVPIYMSYDSLVQRARNDLLAIAVQNEFDGIMWIDADMEWNPEWILDLVNSGKDVIGGTAPRKSIEESYVVKCKPEDLIVNEEGLIKVESLGTGFLYMSRPALMHLWDNSEPYIHNGADKRWAFEVKIQDGDIISEDVLACQKLRDGGFEIYLNPKMTCAHIGTLKFTGNFEEWMHLLKGDNT